MLLAGQSVGDAVSRSVSESKPVQTYSILIFVDIEVKIKLSINITIAIISVYDR